MKTSTLTQLAILVSAICTVACRPALQGVRALNVNGALADLAPTSSPAPSPLLPPAVPAVYALCEGAIYQYGYDARTGALAPLDPPSVIAGSGGRNIAIHPNGHFAYADAGNSGSGAVFQYAIDPLDGRLTPLSPPSIAVPNAAYVIVHPTGRYAFAADTAGNISVLTVDPVGGGLTFLRSLAVGPMPLGLVLNPTGTRLLVSNYGSSVVQLSFFPATGNIVISPVAFPGGGGWVQGVFPQAANSLYLPNNGSGDILQFSWDGFTATALATPSVPSGGTATDNLIIGADDLHAYAINGSGNIGMFARDGTTGALAPLSPATLSLPLGNVTRGILSPDGYRIFAAHYTQSKLSASSVDAATGLLSPSPVNLIDTGPQPRALAISFSTVLSAQSAWGGGFISANPGVINPMNGTNP